MEFCLGLGATRQPNTPVVRRSPGKERIKVADGKVRLERRECEGKVQAAAVRLTTVSGFN